MLLQVEHDLRFRYDDWVRESFLELRMEPGNTPHQTVRSFFLAVAPPTRVERYLDWNESRVHYLGITDYHDRIEVQARSLVDTHPVAPGLETAGEPPLDAARLGPLLDFASLGGPVRGSERLDLLAAELRLPSDAPLRDQVRAVGTLVYGRLEYRPGVTHYASTTDHALEERAGVCQDFAHVMLALLRLRRIACRYVSGYLHVGGEGEPAQSHAWVEVLGEAGCWLGFDPTHDRPPDERYVSVATGRHYDDVPPNRGVYRGAARETLEAEVRTSAAAPEDSVALQQRIERVEVPVYRDVPVRPALPRLASEEQAPEAAQQ